MSSGNPFKSITYYNLAANTQDTLDKVTITGPGIVVFLKWYSGSKITIDNEFKYQSSLILILLYLILL